MVRWTLRNLLLVSFILLLSQPLQLCTLYTAPYSLYTLTALHHLTPTIHTSEKITKNMLKQFSYHTQQPLRKFLPNVQMDILKGYVTEKNIKGGNRAWSALCASKEDKLRCLRRCSKNLLAGWVGGTVGSVLLLPWQGNTEHWGQGQAQRHTCLEAAWHSTAAIPCS